MFRNLWGTLLGTALLIHIMAIFYAIETAPSGFQGIMKPTCEKFIVKNI